VTLFSVLAVPTSLAARVARLERPIRRGLDALTRIRPAACLGAVRLVALVVRLIWLALPTGSLIFDEAYYVNAARAILGLHIPPDLSYAGSPVGLDPNT